MARVSSCFLKEKGGGWTLLRGSLTVKNSWGLLTGDHGVDHAVKHY